MSPPNPKLSLVRRLFARAAVLIIAAALSVSAARAQCYVTKHALEGSVVRPEAFYGYDDEVGTYFDDPSDAIAFEFPGPTDAYGRLGLRLRRDVGYGDTLAAHIRVQFSLDGVSWPFADSIDVPASPDYAWFSVSPGRSFRFVRLSQVDGAGDNFELDALNVNGCHVAGCGILGNGGVEDGLTAWEADAADPAIAVSGDAFVGASALEIRAELGSGWATTGTPVVAGEVLRLGLYGKRVGASTGGRFILRYYDGSSNLLAESPAGRISDSWYTYQRLAADTVPIGAAWAAVVIIADAPAGGVLVDEVCLTRESASCGLLRDAGFSDAGRASHHTWRVHNGARLASDTLVFSSVGAFAEYDAGAQLLPGEEYVLSFGADATLSDNAVAYADVRSTDPAGAPVSSWSASPARGW